MAGPNDRLNILVVDDEGEMRRTVRHTLSRALPAATILEANDGADALRRLGVQPFDLVVIDVRMSRMDGFGVIKRIESLVKTHRPKSAILMGTPEDRASTPAEWSHLPFLEKPGSPEALSGLLKRALDPAALKQGIRPRAPGTAAAGAQKVGAPLSPAELAQQRALGNASTYLEPFLLVSLDVLCKAGKLPAKRDRIYLRGVSEASGDYSFVQALGNSEVALSLAISFDTWTLLAYSATLLGKTFTEPTEEFKVAFEALCRTIFQTTREKLAERGQALDLGVYSFQTGRGHSVRHSGAEGACVALRFETPHGHFTLETVVDRKGATEL